MKCAIVIITIVWKFLVKYALIHITVMLVKIANISGSTLIKLSRNKLPIFKPNSFIFVKVFIRQAS